MIVAVKRGQHDRGCQKGESEKGGGLQTIYIKRYALLVGAGLRITYLLSLRRHAHVSIERGYDKYMGMQVWNKRNKRTFFRLV
jgi:hypothetical protein